MFHIATYQLILVRYTVHIKSRKYVICYIQCSAEMVLDKLRYVVEVFTL
jgi:hypothetical protein